MVEQIRPPTQQCDSCRGQAPTHVRNLVLCRVNYYFSVPTQKIGAVFTVNIKITMLLIIHHSFEWNPLYCRIGKIFFYMLFTGQNFNQQTCMDVYLRYEELSSSPNVEYIAGGKAWITFSFGFQCCGYLKLLNMMTNSWM